MAVEYERWNGAGDLLDIVDNRLGQHNTFMADQDAKRRMVAASGANGIMELRPAPEGSSAAYTAVMHTGMGQCGPIPVCGNGSRCAAAYACQYGLVPAHQWDDFTFITGDGVHTATVKDMPAEDAGEDSAGSRRYDVTISMADINRVLAVGTDGCYVNTGAAHYVHFLAPGIKLKSVDVIGEGRRLAALHAHLGGHLLVIVNFVTVEGDTGVHARCYDTGSDTEILACGTASMAITVAVAARAGGSEGPQHMDVHWSTAAVRVGYTRTGDLFTHNSLRSVVFREVRDNWGPDDKQ